MENDEAKNGVFVRNLSVGDYFILFPSSGQLNRPLLKSKKFTGSSRHLVAMNLETLEEVTIDMDKHVLIIHF